MRVIPKRADRGCLIRRRMPSAAWRTTSRRGNQPQERAANGAASVTESGLPSTVAVATTVAWPACTEGVRVENELATLLPGCTPAVVLDPNGVEVATSTAKAELFFTWTVSTTFPPTQRVLATADTSGATTGAAAASGTVISEIFRNEPGVPNVRRRPVALTAANPIVVRTPL